MNRNTLAVAMLFLGAVLLGGCAGKQKTSGGAPQIDETWLARVPPEDLGSVEQARAERRQAEDQVNRTKVDVEDAKNQMGVAKSEHDAAKAEVKAAEKQVKASKKTGDQAAISQAQQGHEKAKLGEQAAQKRIDLAKARIDGLETRQKLAEARLQTRDAELSRAEYNTLKQHGDTRVKDIEPMRFDQAITASQAKEAELQTEFSQKQQMVRTAENAYRQAQQQLQASQPSQVPAG